MKISKKKRRKVFINVDEDSEPIDELKRVKINEDLFLDENLDDLDDEEGEKNENEEEENDENKEEEDEDEDEQK